MTAAIVGELQGLAGEIDGSRSWSASRSYPEREAFRARLKMVPPLSDGPEFDGGNYSGVQWA